MDLSEQSESENVEDRRGSGGVVMAGGGIGTVVIGLIMYFVFGGNPPNIPIQPPGQQAAEQNVDPNDPQKVFVSKVLKSTEKIWGENFKEHHRHYEEPKLHLFSGQVNSACGMADAAVGPFYCPGDHKVYLDLSFFNVLENQLGAGGDFAKAYVIAHEVGHHVQNQLGYTRREEELAKQEGKNRSSVRLELQADYLAGVWGHKAQHDLKLDKRDLDSALNAAHQIGDDALQKAGRGRVVPDSFTHGTSQQRINSFRSGFESGKFDKQSLDYFFDTPYERLEK